MKLKEYVAKINELVAKYPNATVVYASDLEGNSYSDLLFEPSIGFFNKKMRNLIHKMTEKMLFVFSVSVVIVIL